MNFSGILPLVFVLMKQNYEIVLLEGDVEIAIVAFKVLLFLFSSGKTILVRLPCFKDNLTKNTGKLHLSLARNNGAYYGVALLESMCRSDLKVAVHCETVRVQVKDLEDSFRQRPSGISDARDGYERPQQRDHLRSNARSPPLRA
ncbi:hypothetical protein MLD38_011458 [Melastoma candidum]|uniref:Uncharacterized protein n=1 Tax=Melastoma candidum TaxID=119954 RepID=A0ACB9R4G4_9MYRT|nr:hypothetical protein MLD38_011458 [Melastoma candidum]